MHAIEQFIAKWYFGEIKSILITFVFSLAVFTICEILIQWFLSPLSPDRLVAISYHIINVLSWPSRISMAASVTALVIKIFRNARGVKPSAEGRNPDKNFK